MPVAMDATLEPLPPLKQIRPMTPPARAPTAVFTRAVVIDFIPMCVVWFGLVWWFFILYFVVVVRIADGVRKGSVCGVTRTSMLNLEERGTFKIFKCEQRID